MAAPAPASNIVTSWISYQRERGRSVTLICQMLADEIGMVVTPSRLREWEDGRRPLPHSAYNLMLFAVLGVAVGADRGDAGALTREELFDMLALPCKSIRGTGSEA